MDNVRAQRLAVLADRVGQVIERLGSIAQAARITGLPVNTVSRMKAGENEPQALALAIFAEKTGVSLEWLIGLRDDDTPTSPARIVEVPGLDVRAAAGAGHFNHVANQVESFPFPRAFIERLGGSPSRTECLRCTGDSMSPTIEPGALLLVDRSQSIVREPKKTRAGAKDEIFVFIQGDDLRVKKLRRLSKDFLALISDNISMYPPEILDRDEAARVKIIGKVIWWDNRL